MADEKERPKRTLEILVGTGGIGAVLGGIAALLVLFQPQNRPVPPDPPRPVVVTAQPEPYSTEQGVATLTPTQRPSPTPAPPEPPAPTPAPTPVPTGVADVEYSIALSPYGSGQHSVTANVAIDGQNVGTLHIQSGSEFSTLKLTAAAGFHTYNILLDKIEDLGLGPQQSRLTGAGQIYITPGIRFVVGDDGFNAVMQPG